MRKVTTGVLVAVLSLTSIIVGADESVTIFDRLHQLDATAIGEQRRSAEVQNQVEAIDSELDARWTSVDVAMRAAAPIRNDVTHGLVRWLTAHRAAEREAMDGPHAGADTRRLLTYAAGRALPVRLRDVDVVRRADAERSGFTRLMALRAHWSVELARTAGTAEAATGARTVLIADARTGSADADLKTTDQQFEETLATLPSDRMGVDFHRFKGTLARPLVSAPDFQFGADAALIRATGWTYRASVGDEVHVVHDGVVTFVGAAQGWGLVVVVDHGGGYMTSYGHLESAGVAVGDEVKRADVIAAAGESGSLDGARLYFEMRRNGKPVDPAQWFLKR